MSKSLGIVELPTTSRFPNRTSWADRRLGNLSLVEWIVRRVSDAQLLDEVVLLTDRSHKSKYASLFPSDIAVFSGDDDDDALRRFASCIEDFQATQVVRVCAGNCFVDPELLDRLINSARCDDRCDYASYRRANGPGAVHATIGLVGEWITADAVGQADRRARRPADRNDSTRFVYGHPERFRLRLLPMPAPFDSDSDDVRLTVQVEEDWDHVQAILDDLGPDAVDWQNIAMLLDRQPAMRERMASLNRAATTR
jgi:spore coat polysaccharide biosynthesis protein SpsF